MAKAKHPVRVTYPSQGAQTPFIEYPEKTHVYVGRTWAHHTKITRTGMQTRCILFNV